MNRMGQIESVTNGSALMSIAGSRAMATNIDDYQRHGQKH